MNARDMKRLRASILAILVGAGGAPAMFAAPVDGAGVLEEIIVTTTRRAESEQKIPVSITALSAEDLAHLGVRETRDLVGFAPNLASQGSFGAMSPSFFIRGIGSTQFNPNANSKVGVYVDDVYLNSPAVHGAQLFDIDRVEIARGPQGYLFGQNTTGGLIRAITRKPEIGAGLTGNAEITAGRFQQLAANGAIGGDIGAGAAWRIAATHERRDGTMRNDLLGQNDGEIDTTGWRAQLLLQPAERFSALVNVHGSRSDGQLTPYKQLGLVDPATFGPCAAPALGSGCTDFFGYADTTNMHEGQWDVANQVTRVKAFGASVTLDWNLGAYTVTAISSYEKNDSLINEDTDAGPLDVVHGGYIGEPRQFSQELRFTSSADQRIRWIGGLYYFDEKFDGTVLFSANGFGPGIFSGVGPTLEGAGQESAMSTKSYAVYGTVDLPFTDATKLSVGLRYTHEKKDLDYAAFLDDTTTVTAGSFLHNGDVSALAFVQTIDFHENRSWNNLSGRISLDHQFSDDVLGYVSLARGFNSGNFNGGALFDQSEATLVDPEILMSYELGLKSQFAKDRVRVNAGVFYYDFKDQQVFILASGSGGSPFQQLSNAAASTLYGAELEMTWAPVQGLLIQAGAGYTHTKFDEFNSELGGDLSGNRLPSAPQSNFNLAMRYEWPALGGKLAVEADTKYMSKQFFSVNNDPLLAQGGYGLVGARLSYATVDDRFVFSLWGKNLGNRDYLLDAFDLAAFGFDQLVVGDPRTYGATLSYRFH